MNNYLIEVLNKTHSGERPTVDYWKIVSADTAKDAAKKGWKEICEQLNLNMKNHYGINRSRSWKFIDEEIQHRLRYNNSIEEFIFPFWNGRIFLKPQKRHNKRY